MFASRRIAMTRASMPIRILLAAFLASAIVACTPSTNIKQPPAQAQEIPQTPSTPEALIAQARKSQKPDTRYRLLLQAADKLQTGQEFHRARQVLRSIPMDQLSDNLKDQYLLLAMRSILALDDISWAQRIAPALTPELFSQYPKEDQAQAAQMEANTLSKANASVAAATVLIKAEPLFDDETAQKNRNLIWHWLETADLQTLNQAAKQATSYAMQGWLELALSVRDAGPGLDQQSQAVQKWQKDWPQHPAAQNLPDELALIVTLVQQRPQHIVLALPLEGHLANAGRSILEGFIGAYYQDQESSRHQTRIEVVDTSSGHFDQQYEALVKKHPDLVIGPLSKKAVASLAKMQSLPVPVLALNYLDSSDTPVPSNLFQFGLSPDDDVQQIAERLQRRDYHQVLALAPEGNWGDRVLSNFEQDFSALGGTVLDTARFTSGDTLKHAVADVLGATRSRDRAIEVERTINRDVKFEPRRRQDVDAIVMVASPSVARQIKPLLEFYFAGSLPVYATSTTYSGEPNAQADSDLDGVRFTDLPWVLKGQNSRLRQQLKTTFPNLFSQYDRLFALGADAYLLSSRLPLLRQVPNSVVQGHTGILSMAPDGQIHRKLDWAIFKNGKPQPLPPLSPNQAPQQPAPQQPASQQAQQPKNQETPNAQSPQPGTGHGSPGGQIPAASGP